MVGTTVSHYRVLQHLGAGGMGIVYLAEDERLHRKVALKFLPPAMASDTHARARFTREAQSASALDHPNIATIYEIGEWDGQPFIAMAYYEGETLRQRLARGPLPLKDVAGVLGDVAAGLEAAHTAGIVHRDLKPANIILTGNGPAKILDFGLAKMMSVDQATATRMTGSGTTVGTVAYMAPEQAQGREVDPRADVWALGVMAYEMLTGQLPFNAENVPATLLAIITETPPAVKALRPDVPPELERVVTRALLRDRDARTITAAAIVQEVAGYRVRVSSGTLGAVAAPTPWMWMKQARVAIPVVLVLVALISVGGWAWQHNAKIRWAHEVAIPEIKRLADQEQYAAAFALAHEAEQYIGGDRALATAQEIASRPVAIETRPPGADVYYKTYAADDATSWTHLGTSPIKAARVPLGLLRFKIEKSGWATVEDAWLVGSLSMASGVIPIVSYVLDTTTAVPPGMVRASTSGAPFYLRIPGFDNLPPVTLNDYWIDKFEVTNRQYKQFVASGGYVRREYWRQEFFKEGRRVPWEEAVTTFKDTTGLPGPATWEGGDYPAGRDDYPVAGVSWYEAAAYAEYAGKALPTIYHWSAVGRQTLSGAVPLSNFGGRGLAAVGTQRAVHRFGARDMAGNAKEWCWNLAGSGKRFILGGSWDEPDYMFVDADARSPWERAANFGFRCVKYFPHDTLAGSITAALEIPSRDYSREKPVTDEVFRAYARLYAYDKTDLKAVTEAVDQSSEDWRREKVTFSAAYGNERVIAYFYLPKHSKPPFQTVVFFPGSGALTERSSERGMYVRPFDFMVANGRAVLHPVFKSTYERGDGFESDVPNMTNLWRDHVIMWSKDLGRSIDYLETRPDIDRTKVAYYGYSWGGQMGAILPALEPRLKASLILVGGFDLRHALPEVEPINFAPRITIPTLMLNGRYDFFYPAACCQEAMFRFLGAAPENKRRVVYETGHNVPRPELIKETLNWLDKYLGPVNR
jgi:eukaryotic-like serine/threonine-protein kinase